MWLRGLLLRELLLSGDMLLWLCWNLLRVLIVIAAICATNTADSVLGDELFEAKNVLRRRWHATFSY